VAENLPSWAKIPFVPRPPISERTDTPGTSPLTHVFDTNAVRALGRLRESSWKKLLSLWKAKGYTTGWIPWVAYEITSTHFIFKGAVVPQLEVERIVLAVQRFDILTDGDVLPDVDQLFVRSMYDFVGAPGGPSHLNEIEDDLRSRIHICKQVTNRDQVGQVPDGNGSFYVGFQDNKIVWYKAFKSNFASHAPKAVAAMEKLIKDSDLTKDSSDEDVAKAILPYILSIILRKAERLQVPQQIRDGVAKLWAPPEQLDPTTPREPHMIPDLPFTVAMLAECWYYAEFARGRLTRAHLDNDGPDFKIATYMSKAEHFVTNDTNLRKLISRYTLEADRRIIKPARFYRSALG
jgi:hypothetical protein